MRFNFQTLPSNAPLANHLRNPIGCAVRPLEPINDNLRHGYTPLKCAACAGTAQPHQRICMQTMTWTCALCSKCNKFPKNYAAHLQAGGTVPELINTHAEYVLMSSPETPPPAAFVYMLDLCTSAVELQAQKDNVQKLISRLPSDAVLGLVTVASHVNAYSFDGQNSFLSVAIQADEILNAQSLKIKLHRDCRDFKFLVSVEQFGFEINEAIEKLAAVPTPDKGQRFERCTGTALGTTLALLEAFTPGLPATVVSFIAGPSTTGYGRVAELSKNVTLRTFFDMEQKTENAQLVDCAKKFYAELTQRAVKNNTTFDLYACSLDQVGLMELAPLAHSTGGIMVQGDSASAPRLQLSLDRQYNPDIPNVTDVVIEVRTSANLGVAGMIGPASSIGLDPLQRTEKEKRLGDGAPTTVWKTSSMSQDTYLALYLRPTSGNLKGGNIFGHVQVTTSYTDRTGARLQRVSTAAVAMSNDAAVVGNSVDVEAHAFLTARVAAWIQRETGYTAACNVIDRALIRAFELFGKCEKRKPESLVINPLWWNLANIMYHMKRSPLINVFGSSPDDTFFKTHWLNRACVEDVIRMCRPELWRFDAVAQPAQCPFGVQMPLESASLSGDAFFVLDSFFETILARTANVHNWVKNECHLDPRYADTFGVVKTNADTRLADAFYRGPIAPLYVDTHEGGSQFRFVTAAVEVSFDHRNRDPSRFDATVVLSEERKYSEFVGKLIAYVVGCV